MDALRSLVSLAPTGGGYLRDEPAFSAHPKVLDDTPRINSQQPFRFRTVVPRAASTTERPEWLPSGDRPLVYMTFGTVTVGEDRTRHVYAASVDAVADLPVSVLLTTGKNAPHDLIQSVPDNVIVREFVPQAEVFEHAELMVCHGGSGTVLGGLASGVPMVVVPLFADQPDNARCLESAGLCISVSGDDIPSLRAAITNGLEDGEMRRRAIAAANDFAALPTVDDSLEILVGG
nr:nucleotide disphospho-sugar-binding domain-containing protein [Marivita cryptomonadis]